MKATIPTDEELREKNLTEPPGTLLASINNTYGIRISQNKKKKSKCGKNVTVGEGESEVHPVPCGLLPLHGIMPVASNLSNLRRGSHTILKSLQTKYPRNYKLTVNSKGGVSVRRPQWQTQSQWQSQLRGANKMSRETKETEFIKNAWKRAWNDNAKHKGGNKALDLKNVKYNFLYQQNPKVPAHMKYSYINT